MCAPFVGPGLIDVMNGVCLCAVVILNCLLNVLNTVCVCVCVFGQCLVAALSLCVQAEVSSSSVCVKVTREAGPATGRPTVSPKGCSLTCASAPASSQCYLTLAS